MCNRFRLLTSWRRARGHFPSTSEENAVDDAGAVDVDGTASFFFSFFLFLFSIEIVDENFTEPQESDNWRRSARRRYGTATPKAAASPRPAASRRRAPRPTSTPEPARRSPRPSDNRPSSTAECATSPIAR